MPLAKAVSEADARTGKKIGTRVEQGKWQVIEIVNDKKVIPLSDWLEPRKIIDFINQIK